MDAPVPSARIVVLGSANMDLVVSTDRLPSAGETVAGNSFATIAGGKGSNKAIAAARAGADVEFVGAVGDDLFALELRQTLVDNEVGTEFLREVPGPSGVAMITVDGAGENRIIVVGNANSTLTSLSPDELDLIANADLLVCELEIPLATVTTAIRHARAHAVTTLLNPSPVQQLPGALSDSVDVLVVNAGEARALGSATVDTVPHVITTLGARGAHYRGPDGTELSVPTLPVNVVDTTAAGDAFTGVLAAFWQRGPETALRWACAAGALASTKLGAAVSLPQRKDIEALL
ncbi:ribokinase [Skermania sp. ID1734]|uniref:ribokinase n=1 Tax=Skermania sp. ID1734 TaxID=2597516 RepID=UPI00117D021B|nr:ribokinase [Skermania sp. ID1734]TSE00022.1 ribokinase [Skermania sp. ID1734]